MPRSKPSRSIKTNNKPVSRSGRVFGLILLLLLIGAVLAGILAYNVVSAPQPQQTPLDFELEPGSGRKVAEQLQAQGVIESPLEFRLLARLTGAERKLKAGSYTLTQPISLLDLLRKLTDGDTAMLSFTLVEGANWRTLRTALDANPDLRHETQNMSDSDLLAALKIDASSPEGQFFPDTYHVDRGSSDLKLLVRAHERMQKKLDAAWQKRAPDLSLKSPYEALIMASLVEKETGHAPDRPMVAGVFLNRLKTGMRLQTDPSVIYGLGTSYNGSLRKSDLEADTPWNTYTRAGLPPTPIANPGEAALLAAVQPANTRALYFVSRGDGSSQFSENLSEHNAAVRKYILSAPAKPAAASISP
ncbi:endolytic transglycosylase MltG [Silvimonas soli]|uniref:endolytic transglycosylase MltG n=1 Tax=Silvimonas soli TaxID=2980100 RepID=UPI0024B323B5|nr:endolytic transglycosylase MltG [Silvimonas soli]